jgi:hypothetical protein
MRQEERKCWDKEGEKSGISFAPSAMGLNNNLEFMGKQLHVQTENTGFPVARIVTQVFCRGRVVLSRKSEYPSGVREAPDPRKIRELMHTQHFQVIQEIEEKQTRIMEKR